MNLSHLDHMIQIVTFTYLLLIYINVTMLSRAKLIKSLRAGYRAPRETLALKIKAKTINRKTA